MAKQIKFFFARFLRKNPGAKIFFIDFFQICGIMGFFICSLKWSTGYFIWWFGCLWALSAAFIALGFILSCSRRWQNDLPETKIEEAKKIADTYPQYQPALNTLICCALLSEDGLSALKEWLAGFDRWNSLRQRISDLDKQGRRIDEDIEGLYLRQRDIDIEMTQLRRDVAEMDKILR
jgi:hypothetical protein